MLTTAAVVTERFTPEVVKRLKACDKIETFSESGWFFAYGHLNGTIVVKTHANSREEYNAAMNPQPYFV
jgi:hypothetical protein